MKKWKSYALGAAVQFQRGHDLPDSERVPGKIPVVGSAGITGYHNIAKAHGPGVTLGRSGASIGKAFYIQCDYWPHNASLFATDFKGNVAKFIYYYLKLLDVSYLNSGSAQPSLNRNILHSIGICIPETQVQGKIAAILSAYDDIIEVNERRIALLEKMAEELYREWFVRMRFPGHEKTKTEKGIPEGWELRALSSICNETRSLIRKKAISDSTRYIGLEHIKPNAFICDEHGYARDVQSDKLVFQSGQILFGKIRPYLHKVILASWNGVCSSDIIVLEPIRKEYQGYLYLTVSSDNFIDLATTASTGTKMPRADWDFLCNQMVVIPSIEILGNFQTVFSKLCNEMLMHQSANAIMRHIRDRLLSRLMSGSLDVEELDIAFPPSMEDELAAQSETSSTD